MARAKRKEVLEWIVHMRVERDISVFVNAVDEGEARAKASEWDIEGDEVPGDTINWTVTRIERNE